MDTLHTINETRAWLAREREQNSRIALVPTMGNLHDGHLTLVEAALKNNSVVVVSIFVNPLQFGPDEDFDSYPRTLEADCKRLQSAGAHLVFAPNVGEMYPQGQTNHVEVKLPHLANLLCGEHRPGHFDGVGTVVMKLLNIVQPESAFFGEKDYQQLQLLRIITQQLNVPVKVEGVPTVRAPDGLALSSRNQYLSETERAAAPLLHTTLLHIAEEISGGCDNFVELQEDATRALQRAGFKPDYIEVRDAQTLRVPDKECTQLRIIAAAQLGAARLIDNIAAQRRLVKE